MNKGHLELNSDYLISSFSGTTATGFSELMDHEIRHDQITRFLSKEDYTLRDLWLLVKRQVRQVETADGALIFDDTLIEKPHTDENDIIWLALGSLQGLDDQGSQYFKLSVPDPGDQHSGGF